MPPVREILSLFLFTSVMIYMYGCTCIYLYNDFCLLHTHTVCKSEIVFILGYRSRVKCDVSRRMFQFYNKKKLFFLLKCVCKKSRKYSFNNYNKLRPAKKTLTKCHTQFSSIFPIYEVIGETLILLLLSKTHLK